MRITQISINFSETCNLGDYSNTKPAIELTAQLEATDDPVTVLQELIGLAKEHLHKEIDKELSIVGRELKYYKGPKFAAVASERYKFYGVVPHKARVPNSYAYRKGILYEDALAAAQQEFRQDDYVFFDCADGNLEPLMAYIQQCEEQFDRQLDERRRRESEKREEEHRRSLAAMGRFFEEDEENEEEDE